MTELFYVAFIVDRDLSLRETVVVDAGVDLLAGPYLDRATAEYAIRQVCQRHPRLAAFAGLATFLLTPDREAPVRMAVISVNQAQVVAYAHRHGTELPWPPPLMPLPMGPKRPRLTPTRKDRAHADAQ